MQVILVDSVTKEESDSKTKGQANKPTYLFKMKGRFSSGETTIPINGAGKLKKSGSLSVGGNSAVGKINNALKDFNHERAQKELPPLKIVVSSIDDAFVMRLCPDDEALLDVGKNALKHHGSTRSSHPGAGRDQLSAKAKARL